MKLNFILLMLITMVLSSCSFSGAKIPSDHYYRLPEVDTKKQTTKIFETILVNAVKVEGLYHERSILYVEQKAPLEVKRYHYHYWVETPAKLIRKYVQNHLLQSGLVDNVLVSASRHVKYLETDITIHRFERNLNQGGVQILVSLQMSANNTQDQAELLNKLYSAKVNAHSDSMHATAEAFGQALNQIMLEFTADLIQKNQ